MNTDRKIMELFVNCHSKPVEGRLYFIKSWIRQAHHDIFGVYKITVFFLIVALISCKSVEKPNWQERLRAKENIRFQIPVFEIENLTREKRISLSNEFALLWKKHSGYSAIVLDETIKADFIRRNASIPSTNFALQSKFSARVLRFLVVDLETGEILSYGKMNLSSEEELPKQFETMIAEQLLKRN